MKGNIMNNNLIECILNLLHIPRNNISNIVPNEPEAQAAPPAPADMQGHLTAQALLNFIDEMPGGFLIYQADEAESIVYANKALLRISGCGSLAEFQTLTGNSFKGFVYYEDLESVEQSIKEQITNSIYDLDYVEYRIMDKNGHIHWLEDFGHFIHSHGMGDFFYVFISDVTKKKLVQQEEHDALMQKCMKNEQKLQNMISKYAKERAVINQEHLRRLEVIEGLSINYDSILYADLDADKILPYRLSVRTNVQFDKKFQAKSYRWYHFDYINTWVHPEDREAVSRSTEPDYIRQKLSESKTFYINYRVLLNTKLQYLQLRIVNVSKKSQVSQIVMGYRKVDEEVRREMEQKQLLEHALDDANLAIVAKNTFLSNMSHDMRTPLNAIFGYTALAKDHLSDPAAALEYLAKIESSSAQLLDLIEKVLEIAWTQSDDIRLSESDCNLWEILQSVHTALLPQAFEKNITFSLNAAGLTHGIVTSDPDKLKQILTYLAGNAVKYTPDGGRVNMIVMELESLPNNYAVYQFVVEDNGIGISPEFLDHIYEPFEREKNTTLCGIYGTGLGLTITKQLTEVMGGDIEAQSKSGVGSRFTVTLRLKIQNHKTLPEVNIEDTLNYLMSRKILLVEDNEINLEIETAILEELGLEIDTATDGSIAVEKMQQAKPGEYALILMDIQMPVMNGRQAAKAIRNLKDKMLSHIPIIALSADAFESDKRKSIESGMDAHLPKPIDVPVLLETIGRTLQTHAALYGN
ncbi:MAG: response regulator [Eubacterium sp.]|nr:response regulator [Eubacterium sp.]